MEKNLRTPGANFVVLVRARLGVLNEGSGNVGQPKP